MTLHKCFVLGNNEILCEEVYERCLASIQALLENGANATIVPPNHQSSVLQFLCGKTKKTPFRERSLRMLKRHGQWNDEAEHKLKQKRWC